MDADHTQHPRGLCRYRVEDDRSDTSSASSSAGDTEDYFSQYPYALAGGGDSMGLVAGVAATGGGGPSWSDYANLASAGLSATGIGGLGSVVAFAGAAASVPQVRSAAVGGWTRLSTGYDSTDKTWSAVAPHEHHRPYKVIR